MLSAFLYILLGVFDALAVVTLVLKLYMLPVWEYRRKILFYAIGIALFSFLMRVVIGVPKLDLPFQYLFMVIFFRFGLGIKTHLGAFSAGSGLTAYINLQLFVYLFANFSEQHNRVLSITLLGFLFTLFSYLLSLLHT